MNCDSEVNILLQTRSEGVGLNETVWASDEEYIEEPSDEEC